MDFLATVKKRLEELEQQARDLQALEQPAKPASNSAGGTLFQARSKAGGLGGAPKSAPPRPSAQSLASRDGFTTPRCATADISSVKTESESSGLSPQPLNRRLIDDLQGRLDEAFLLSEVLGAPRCVRGWDDD